VIKTGAILGAITGAGVAVIMLSLEYIRPFSADANAFNSRLTFKLCPFYILGFTNLVTTNVTLVLVTILGNALLYALLFVLIATAVFLFRKAVVRG
jgi:hypothetical protein